MCFLRRAQRPACSQVSETSWSVDCATLLRRQVFCGKIAIKNHFSHDCAPWACFSHGEHHKSSKQRVLFCHCCFMVITQLYLFIVSGRIGFHIIMAPTNTFLLFLGCLYFDCRYFAPLIVIDWLSFSGWAHIHTKMAFHGPFQIISIISRAAMKR